MCDKWRGKYTGCNGKVFHICHRYEWDSERQHRKSGIDFGDGVQGRIRTAKRE